MDIDMRKEGPIVFTQETMDNMRVVLGNILFKCDKILPPDVVEAIPEKNMLFWKMVANMRFVQIRIERVVGRLYEWIMELYTRLDYEDEDQIVLTKNPMVFLFELEKILEEGEVLNKRDKDGFKDTDKAIAFVQRLNTTMDKIKTFMEDFTYGELL